LTTLSKARMPQVDGTTIERAVLRMRGLNVLLDADLAALYGTDVRTLNQAVARNAERFPVDFMFQLTQKELDSLRSQVVILKSARGRHRKYLPKAFTEQGVAMLSSVLRSPRAVRVNIEIMRAFVQLRRVLGANEDLVRKLDALEQKYDNQFRTVFRAIRELMAPSVRPRRVIGFTSVKTPSGRRQSSSGGRPARSAAPEENRIERQRKGRPESEKATAEGAPGSRSPSNRGARLRASSRQA